eukprot:jgi/Hompol1/6392/HPOL_004968-RA
MLLRPRCWSRTLKSNVPLPYGPRHDEFIVKNASAALKDTGAADAGGKRKADEQLSPAEIKRKFTSALIMSLAPQDRERLCSLGANRPASSEPLVPAPLRQTPPIALQKAGFDVIPRSCKEDMDLPSIDTLGQRLRFVSALNGLENPPSQDAIELVSFALEHYLKNLLDSTLNVLGAAQPSRNPLLAAQFAASSATSPNLTNKTAAHLAQPLASQSAQLHKHSLTAATSGEQSGVTTRSHSRDVSQVLNTSVPINRIGLDDMAFVFDFLPHMDSETLERIALEAT